ncbi:MAG: undecaprenyl-diphosphate phosphatase [Anaerovoracaceae bacterium]|jgi:undecaprenyl-diphosphatase
MGTLTYLQSVILGLVQGLAEFLPVSSSGHLALLQHFFGISGDSVLLFTVLLHVGTLVSVFIVYWRDIADLLIELVHTFADLFSGRGLRINCNPTRRLGFMIIVATIPTGLIGVLFNDTFEGFYSSITVIGIGLLITGVILMVADKMGRGRKNVKRMLWRNAVFIGIMQGIAITPGISRSGSTLFGGLITGLERKFAVKFAFLISIPSILGSVVMEFPAAIEAGTANMAVGPVLAGIAVAAVSGLIAIKAMIKLVSDKKLSYFSYYVWAVGAAVIIYSVFFE